VNGYSDNIDDIQTIEPQINDDIMGNDSDPLSEF
jgi:hypothetical protein